eukprot:TRINITY_DN8087_c0_g1_i1.p1 TRINITY_DN8087_c0_g1~~TRINITY_DN8087_c0_g1_i1.p1  ORF type:complete len:813 (-),score=222.69 TRINITY_DN8087_c0_g1_i1:32-2470(-)
MKKLRSGSSEKGDKSPRKSSSKKESSSKPTTLAAGKVSNPDYAYTNHVYLHPNDFMALGKSRSSADISNYLESGLPEGETFIKVRSAKDGTEFVFNAKPDDQVSSGTLGLNGFQRNDLYYSLGQSTEVTLFIPNNDRVWAQSIDVEVDLASKSSNSHTFDTKTLESSIQNILGNQFLTIQQTYLLSVDRQPLKFKVLDVTVTDLASLSKSTESQLESSLSEDANKTSMAESSLKAFRGLISNKTTVNISKTQGSPIKLSGPTGRGSTGSVVTASPLFRPDWNFAKMGIGGLDNEFSSIFRRAFASRVFPASVVKKLGIPHVKGLLLYGPPGTGKTLMARQIGKMLNGKEPKVVNGPEILNKFVGASEENVRKLFAEAEAEYKAKGDESELHIIIFDEIDAIAPARGTRSGGTGVADTVVTQLLSKIDGVDQLNNILIIGMTNRKDMIDDALLRPGRLEIHMEIGLPSESGRLQIIKIHTNAMVDNKLLSDDVKLEELAENTRNFSGAEIEALVKSASSFAFNRLIDPLNPTKPVSPDKLKVTASDFKAALMEIKPAFGVSHDQFSNCAPNGIINFGTRFEKLKGTGELFIQQVSHSSRTPLVTVLLEGDTGCGKTSLASTLARESNFPFVKMISPDEYLTYSETGKVQKIHKVFEDAYRSAQSVIVIDDVERILDYVPIGSRFSNSVLQTLLVMLKRPPPVGKKLIVFVTTSQRNVLEAMGFMDVFDAVLRVPNVEDGKECVKVLDNMNSFSAEDLAMIERSFKGSIPVKNLFMIAEMAVQGMSGSVTDRFFQCLLDYGKSHVRPSKASLDG